MSDQRRDELDFWAEKELNARLALQKAESEMNTCAARRKRILESDRAAQRTAHTYPGIALGPSPVVRGTVSSSMAQRAR